MDNKELFDVMMDSAKKSADLQDKLHTIIMSNIEHMTLAQVSEFYKATTNYMLDIAELLRRYHSTLRN